MRRCASAERSNRFLACWGRRFRAGGGRDDRVGQACGDCFVGGVPGFGAHRGEPVFDGATGFAGVDRRDVAVLVFEVGGHLGHVVAVAYAHSPRLVDEELGVFHDAKLVHTGGDERRRRGGNTLDNGDDVSLVSPQRIQDRQAFPDFATRGIDQDFDLGGGVGQLVDCGDELLG